MSHAKTADKLLIKPAAGARPAPPRTRGQIIPKARTRRPVTRRVTHDTATTRLASAPDRPTPRVLPTPELVSLLVHGAGSGPWAFDRWSCAPCGVTVDTRSSTHPRQRSRPHPPASQCQPGARPCHASRG